MAIHSLESGNQNSLFGGGHAEGTPTDRLSNAALQYPCCHQLLLARLSQVPNVNFDKLTQAGHLKIPLVGQTIAPASRFKLSFNFLLHDTDNLLGSTARV